MTMKKVFIMRIQNEKVPTCLRLAFNFLNKSESSRGKETASGGEK